MCECGCGVIWPMARFPGPDGSVYAISVYAGCNDCDNPAAVTIQRALPSDTEGADDVREAPELPFHEWGSGIPADAYVTVLDRYVLAEKMQEHIGAPEQIGEDEDDYTSYDAIKEGVDAMPSAVRASVEAWMKIALDKPATPQEPSAPQGEPRTP